MLMYPSMGQLNNDLENISKRDYQWKASFNPGISKQVEGILEKLKICSLLVFLIVFQLKDVLSRSI